MKRILILIIAFVLFSNAKANAFTIFTYNIDTTKRPKVQDKISERRVYSFCTKSASFPGGNDALMRFLHDQINDPKLDEITGRLIVRFVVEKDGQITNVTIKSGISALADKAAIDIIHKMPPWIPAQNDEEIVASYYDQPINFKKHK